MRAAAVRQPWDRPPCRGGVIDGRSQVARRRRELIAVYAAALGGLETLSQGQQIDIRKAAELTALAEAARASAFQNGTDAKTMSALVRLEGTAARAVRVLGLPKAGPGRVVPLRERLRGSAT